MSGVQHQEKQLEYISEKGYFLHTIVGDFDDSVIASHIQILMSHPDYFPTAPMLWDLRNAKMTDDFMNITKSHEPIESLLRERVRAYTAIVVADLLAYSIMRMFFTAVTNKNGDDYGIFYSLEDAGSWLIGEHD